MENSPSTKKRLTRSSNRKIAGIIGGFAEYFNMDPTLLRVIYVVLSIASVGFPGLLLYLICWAVIPEKEPEL